MWGTDLTTTITGEGPAAVFVAVDHCSAECVGIHAHSRATRFEALEPIRQGVRRHFGGFAKAIARGLAVRHDHGSQYMSDHFQKEIAFLGIESSPAFVRAPEGNGCAERFIRTLKENLLWVRPFETIEELRQALLAFRETYNTTWLIERHGFISPAPSVRSSFNPSPGGVGFNPVSQKLRAVQKRLLDHVAAAEVPVWIVDGCASGSNSLRERIWDRARGQSSLPAHRSAGVLPRMDPHDRCLVELCPLERRVRPRHPLQGGRGLPSLACSASLQHKIGSTPQIQQAQKG